ncbi:MAG: mechanosensitive ion channel domain-containing protein [Verrucomicrobiales bacterium]
MIIFLAAESLAIAIALAMGLGLRPIARNVVSGVYARDSFPPGSLLEIRDTTATVVEVGPVSTRLENEYGEYFVIPNSHMVKPLLKGTLKNSTKLEKTRIM